MPADLDQFRRENSHGAVIGGKGLVKLGHVAADARSLFHHIHFEACRGKVKGGLNTTDPSANHHNVSKIFLVHVHGNKTIRKFLNYFFWQYVISHFLFSSSYIYGLFCHKPLTLNHFKPIVKSIIKSIIKSIR